MWKVIDDSKVRHVWMDSKGQEHFVSPDYYQENGEPFDHEADNVMEYVRTEIME